MQYDAAGQVELRTLGSNLLKTDYVYFGWGEANGQGRLKRILSGTSANPSSLQELRYNNTSSGAAWYDGVGNTRCFLFSDYLGSTSMTTNSDGTSIGELRYKAY